MNREQLRTLASIFIGAALAVLVLVFLRAGGYL